MTSVPYWDYFLIFYTLGIAFRDAVMGESTNFKFVTDVDRHKS